MLDISNMNLSYMVFNSILDKLYPETEIEFLLNKYNNKNFYYFNQAYNQRLISANEDEIINKIIKEKYVTSNIILDYPDTYPGLCQCSICGDYANSDEEGFDECPNKHDDIDNYILARIKNVLHKVDLKFTSNNKLSTLILNFLLRYLSFETEKKLLEERIKKYGNLYAYLDTQIYPRNYLIYVRRYDNEIIEMIKNLGVRQLIDLMSIEAFFGYTCLICQQNIMSDELESHVSSHSIYEIYKYNPWNIMAHMIDKIII